MLGTRLSGFEEEFNLINLCSRNEREQRKCWINIGETRFSLNSGVFFLITYPFPVAGYYIQSRGKNKILFFIGGGV